MVDNFQDVVEEKSDEELLVMVYQFDRWNSQMLEAVQRGLKKVKMGDIFFYLSLTVHILYTLYKIGMLIQRKLYG